MVGLVVVGIAELCGLCPGSLPVALAHEGKADGSYTSHPRWQLEACDGAPDAPKKQRRIVNCFPVSRIALSLTPFTTFAYHFKCPQLHSHLTNTTR